MISLLCDFGYKPPDYNKILDKWVKVSKKIEPMNSTTAYHRQMLLQSMRNRPNTELLTKTYKDGDKTRRVATGIMVSKTKPDRLRVDYIAGNPFSSKDKRFKGALESVRRKAGDKDIEIDSITPVVERLYNRKLGDKRI